jgi:beta-lactamase regulating signal transducer with metallopeptidase domain
MNEFLMRLAETGPSLTIRATVLFAVASGVALALGKASAAQRHLVWAAALAASLVLPAMHVCAPEWGVLPAFTAKQTSSPAMREAPMAGESPSASMAVASFHESPRGAERAVSAAVSPPASPAPPKAAALSVSVSPGQVLAVLWLARVLLGVVRLVLAVGRIRQFAHRADPATGKTASMLTELARESGIRRPVQCLVSRQSIVPMTWGWLRPVVLLPADAASWSAERLRVVLLHELAHVRRGDAATQFVAELARSLYWFHPLAWWGVHCLRFEQEAACDDRVLAAGAAAEDYAEELVAVTARLPHGLQDAGLAVAMGRRHTIEGRVRSILADDRDRRPVRTVRAAVIGGVFVTLATVAAIVGPAAEAEDKPPVSGARPAAAAELPKDTNTIANLTVEQAKTLAETFPGLVVKIRWWGMHDVPLPDCLPLNGLTKLEADVAGALAGYGKGPLLLNGLTRLDAGSARALADSKGVLVLNALTTLDAATAKALAEFQGKALALDGLTRLDADAAEALAAFKGGQLILSGLTELDEATAKALAAIEKWDGELRAITALEGPDSLAVAQALAKRKGRLSLRNLKKISPKTRAALIKNEKVSLPHAQNLALIPEPDGTATDDLLAPELLRNLTPEQAERLICTHRRPDTRSITLLRFTPVTELKASGLTVTKSIPVEFTHTIAFEGDILSLPALERLTPETAAVLGRHNGVLQLDGVTALNPAAAVALAAFDGELLSLSRVAELDAATAKALAGSKARQLHLSSLAKLDEDTAQALVVFKGEKIWASFIPHNVGSTIVLTPAVARLVSKLAEPSCTLGAVTAFESPDSVAIAKALATRKGPLSLPNLKKISPKTLSALIEKDDIDIPLIETLELIPEPDGSPTEDFVIPERFQKR